MGTFLRSKKNTDQMFFEKHQEKQYLPGTRSKNLVFKYESKCFASISFLNAPTTTYDSVTIDPGSTIKVWESLKTCPLSSSGTDVDLEVTTFQQSIYS